MTTSDAGMRWRAAALVACLLMGAAAASACEADGSPYTEDRPLQVFKVDNPLLDWHAQGLRDARGTVVVAPEPGNLVPLPGGGWLRRTGCEWGELLDAAGRTVAVPYDFLQPTEPGLDVLIAGQGVRPERASLIRGNGERIAGPVYALKHLVGTGLFSFQQARRVGVMDAQGKQVLAPGFDAVERMQQLMVVVSQQQTALFNGQGKNLTGFRKDTYYQVIDGTDWIRACEERAGQTYCRVIDARLRPALAGEFHRIEYLTDIDRWLALPVDSSGAKRDEPREFGESENLPFALLDKRGKPIASVSARDISQTAGNRLLVAFDRPDSGEQPSRIVQGLMDPDGRWVSPPDGDRISPVRTAWADGQQWPVPQYVISRHGEDGKNTVQVIDADGRVLTPALVGEILTSYPSLGLYQVRQDRKVGILDSAGKWRIPLQEMTFEEPRADRLPLPYLMASSNRYEEDDASRHTLHDLRDGTSVFRDDYQTLSADVDYWPIRDDSTLARSEYVLFIARKNGKYGVLDLRENAVVPFDYAFITYLGDGHFYGGRKAGEDPHRIAMPDTAQSGGLRQWLSRRIRELPAPSPNATAPHAGRYAPADAYRDASEVQAAVQRGELSRGAAPMILVAGREAVLDVSMLPGASKALPTKTRKVVQGEQGFDIVLPGGEDSSACDCTATDWPRLSFRPEADGWICESCKAFGLPRRWRLTDPAPNPALP